jgi:RNA polymerase sigma-70 factor (ECF subfamily)
MPLDAMNDVPDDVLLMRYAAGEERAAHALTLRLTPVVMAHAHRLLGDRAEAEDVAQEAMLRLWRIAPDWRMGEAKVTTWLYRVVANLCLDRLRRPRAVALDAIDEPQDASAGVEADMQQDQRQRALRGALIRLPDRQRQAVVLRHIEGLANPEIAEIMGIGVEAVESLTARGRKALSAALAGRRAELGYCDD